VRRLESVQGVEGRARTADGGDVWTLIPVAGFVLGLAVARWWVVAAALPFGAYVLATNGLEGHLGEWVAFVLSTLLACAIACGVALRRLRRHAWPNPSHGGRNGGGGAPS
jgi:uncharacterized membrane protein YccC